MLKRNLKIALGLMALGLASGCSPLQQNVQRQHQNTVQQLAATTQDSTATPDLGVVQQSGLYLGASKIRPALDPLLDKKIPLPMDSDGEKLTVIEFASELSQIIQRPVKVAADVYERREDDAARSTLTDSTGASVAVSQPVSSSGGNFPDRTAVQFHKDSTVQFVLDSTVRQYGLAWRYDPEADGIVIYRYETASFPLLVSNSSRSLKMATASDTLQTTITSEEKLRESIAAAARILLSDEGRAELTEAGTLVVSDRPSSVAAVRSYIEQETRRLKRQVLIRVRLYTMDKNTSNEIGADWNLIFNDGSTEGAIRGADIGITSAVTGALNIVDPTSKLSGSSLDIDAIARDKGLSVAYNNDLLILSGRAGSIRENINQVYLKSVTGSESASSDLVQSTLEPGEFDTGLTFYVHPIANGDEVVADTEFSLRSELEISQASSGLNRIQTPRTADRGTSQVVRLRNGEARVIGRFDVITSESDETGTGTPAFKLAGGASKARLEQRQAILVITADIVE